MASHGNDKQRRQAEKDAISGHGMGEDWYQIMTPQQQLDAIIKGRVAAAVREHLGGDWSRLPTLFTIPRAMFDAWADSVELPCGRVSRVKAPQDGVYVLRDPEGWMVFEQERGVHLPGERVYGNYKEAKRAALALDLLAVLRGAV